MAFQYPPKPWNDGQTVRRDMGDGTVLIGTYDATKNLWSFARTQGDGSGSGIVTTADVFTLNERPDTGTNPFNLTDDPTTVVNQQEANWWLFEDLEKRARKAIVSNTEPTSHPLYTTAEKQLIRGDFWVDTTQDILFWYDGTHWQEFTGGRPPIFSKTEPTVHPDFQPPNDQLIAGDVWFDTTDPDEIVQYTYDGTAWLKIGGEFVHRKGGDSMEGPLKVTGNRTPNADGIESTVETLNVDSGQNSSLNLKHNGATKVYVGDAQTSFQGNIKMNVAGRQIYAGDDNNKKGLAIYNNGVQYVGDYTVDNHVATKKNVEEAIYHDILDPDTNKYVDRAGDSMTGELHMDDAQIKMSNRSNGETMIRAERKSGEYPLLLDLKHNNDVGSTLGGYDIKVGGNTSYNQLRIVGSETYISVGGGGGNPTPVKFHKDVDCGNNRFTKLGTATDDTDAVPYGQVKTELAELRDEFIGDLIVGTWGVDNVQSLVAPGTNRMCFVKANGQAAQKFSEAAVIRFYYKDDQGSDVLWDNWDPGEIVSFRQLDDPTVTASFRLLTAANVNANTRSFSVTFIKSENDVNPFGQYMERYAVTLTEFSAPIDPGALDDLYLRLDCSNDPLETELEIKTPDFGEASLSLIGKRDNTTNSTATIAFKSQFDASDTYAGYLTYRTKGINSGEHFFRFNRDVELAGNGLKELGFAQFNDGGVIKHNDNDRITFQAKSTAFAGDGVVQFERPADGRRGFTIRGKNPVGHTDIDLFWTYTNATDGDAVNYAGRTTGEYNIVNKKYVDAALAGIGGGSLEHTPYIANMDGTNKGTSSANPDPRQVAGFYTSGGGSSANIYPGNFNSFLLCGASVISTQKGTNNYEELPDGHDEYWTGTVSVINLSNGGLLYKNTVTRVSRSGEYVTIWVRDSNNTTPKKPMFAYGTINEWTNISVVVEGYRVN